MSASTSVLQSSVNTWVIAGSQFSVVLIVVCRDNVRFMLLLLLLLLELMMMTVASQKHADVTHYRYFFLQSSISDKNTNRQKTSLNKTRIYEIF